MCSLFSPDERLPLEELERRICDLAADLAASTCRWLLLVAEFDARGGWAEWGVTSCAHWLSWRCGITITTAHEHTRVARALGALPLIREAFGAGDLSYSKVRALTRVAMPETEADLLSMARFGTGAQVEKLVRQYAGVIRATVEHARAVEDRQALTCVWDDDGMLRVEGRLTPEDGARLLQALEAADSGDLDVAASARRAEALVSLVAGDSRDTEVVVHVDVATLAADGIRDQCRLEDGPSLAPETARRLSCDGRLNRIIERDGEPLSLGRRRRVVSPALRRSLRSRDGGCRFPGCTNTRFLDAHHIKHWAHGGETDIGNLIQLCAHHHRLLHEGGYTIHRDEHGKPYFRTPQGWHIPETGQRPSMARSLPRSRGDCRPLTPGDSLDYGIAVEGLARRWLPPPGG